jgi:hypothetical protein
MLHTLKQILGCNFVPGSEVNYRLSSTSHAKNPKRRSTTLANSKAFRYAPTFNSFDSEKNY